MPGNPQPTRQEWHFRNVTKAADFWMTIDSINVEDGNAEDLSTFSGSIVDTAASQAFASEDRIEITLDGTKVFGGHIKTRGLAYRSEAGPRVFDIEGQDYTAKLDDSIITRRKSRPKESGADRLAFILSHLNYPITCTSPDLPSGDVDAADMDGLTVREALDGLAEELRLSYYVDYDRDLHIFRTETITAPFALDDANPDFVDSFPYREWRHAEDSVELANAQYVEGEQASAWVEDSASIATYGRQERSIQDEELVTANQIINAGLRANAEVSTPLIDGSFICDEPGLRAGMTFQLSNDLFSAEFAARTFIVTKVTLTALDPHDEDDVAFVRSEVTYSDRRRARPFRKAKHDRDSDLADGDPVTIARYCLAVARNRLQLTGAFQHGYLADEVDFAGPGGPIHDEVTQRAIAHNVPWTSGLCALGLGAQTGDVIEEQWFSFDPGDLDGVVALRVEVELDESSGVAPDRTLLFGIGYDVPTDENQFEPAGSIPAADGEYSFTIPRALLRPSVTQYLVFGAGWRCLRAGNVCTNDVPGALDSVGNALFESGSVDVNPPTLTLVGVEGGGLTPWISGEGDVDGVNATFDVPDWNGKGIPQARVGAVILSPRTDYTWDNDPPRITFVSPPPAGTVPAFRVQS